MSIFNSKRLSFRKWNASDAAFLLELNNDPEVIKYTGDPPFKSEAHAAEFILNYNHYDTHGYGRWLVTLNSNQTPIGWAGLKNQLKNEGFIDLGFRFLKDHWNKGYGTESALACLEYGFLSLGMTEIVGRAALENDASINILEKIGMIEFINNKTCHGLDALHFKISRQEFIRSKEK